MTRLAKAVFFMMKNHEQALLLLRKAAEDEALIDEVLTSERVSDLIICFHLQQAAEKLLKAWLCEAGIVFPKTHDLAKLSDFAGRCRSLAARRLGHGRDTHALRGRVPLRRRYQSGSTRSRRDAGTGAPPPLPRGSSRSGLTAVLERSQTLASPLFHSAPISSPTACR